MAPAEVKLRTARPDDARAMATVDRQSWPASLATSVEGFDCRIAAFAEGQLVAESKGRVVGTAAAQRITRAFLENSSHSYDLVTDVNRFTASHTPGGEFYQLIGVGVLPEFRGSRLGRQLVDAQIEFARTLPGIERILGFTRPAGFHRNRQLAIEDYVGLRGEDGRIVDPVLGFHLEAGARVISIHADFRPNDEEACGYGVLIEYPLKDDEVR